MACYDVSPYTCTYDSGGAGSLPGGGSPDYSSLSTYESDSDNDITGYTSPMILECYDSQVHEDYVLIDGVTGATVNTGRRIHSSSSCATPFDMRYGNGATFDLTDTIYNHHVFSLDDWFIIFENICVRNADSYTSSNQGAIESYSSTNVIRNCVVLQFINGYSTYLGAGLGIYNGVIGYGNIVMECTHGFYIGSFAYEDRENFNLWNNTFVDSVNYNGWYQTSLCYGSWNRFRNNLIQGTSGATYNSFYFTSGSGYENFQSDSGWNCADGTNMDLDGKATYYANSTDISSSFDEDWHPTSSIGLNANSGTGSQYGKSFYASDVSVRIGDVSQNYVGSSSNTQNNRARMVVMGWRYTYYTNGSSDPSDITWEDFSLITRKVKKLGVRIGPYHVDQPRFALYKSSSKTTPSGAELVYDFGQSSGSDVNGYYTFTIPDGSEPEVAYTDFLWAGYKITGSGSNNFSLQYSNPQRWMTLENAWVDIASQVGYDETVAWPSTIPTASYSLNTSPYLFSVEFLPTDGWINASSFWYFDFQNDIAVDGAGTQRSVVYDAAWSIGAIEFVGSGPTPGTTKPQIFMIT